jgi:8-oxo-dGTP diphosphatase
MRDNIVTPQLNVGLISSIEQEVDSIIPYDEIEREHKQDILLWLQSGSNPFRLKKPDIPPKHLVSYFVLVDPEQRSMLLVDHIKAQLWLPTGGHVEFNELPRDAVVREAKEELGIRAPFILNNPKPFFVTVTKTVGLTAGHTDVSLWYLLRGSIHDTPRYDRSEFTDVEWYTFDEILKTDPTIFDPHLQRFTKKLATRLKV